MRRIHFRPNASLADIAFYAYGKTPEALIQNACLALTDAMVDSKKIEAKTEKRIPVLGRTTEDLLYNAMEEVIYLKDAEQLVFSHFEVAPIETTLDYCTTTLRMKGEKIDLKKHGAHADVKAVTWHDFGISKTKNGYRASVTLDV